MVFTLILCLRTCLKLGCGALTGLIIHPKTVRQKEHVVIKAAAIKMLVCVLNVYKYCFLMSEFMMNDYRVSVRADRCV